MDLIQDQVIQGVHLAIDEKHFVNCTLIDCTLEYWGYDVIFEKTILRQCRYVFFERARTTVQFLENVGLLKSSGKWLEFPEATN